MRKTAFLILLFLSVAIYAEDGGSLLLSNRRLVFSYSGLSYIFPDNIFSYEGKFLSYGRLDRKSFLNTQFNPYREKLYYSFDARKSNVRGIRGMEVKYDGFSFVLALGKERLSGLSYDSKFVDIALLYYTEDWKIREGIYNYRKDLRRDVFSLGLSLSFPNMIDASFIFSYSPHLGCEYFFRTGIHIGHFLLSVKAGNTFLSESDDELELGLEYQEEELTFDLMIRYGKESVYASLFRKYESLFKVRYNVYDDFYIETSWRLDFTKEGERKKRGKFILEFGQLRLGTDTSLMPIFRVKEKNIDIGSNKKGPYVKIKFPKEKFSIKLNRQELVLEFRMEFP